MDVKAVGNRLRAEAVGQVVALGSSGLAILYLTDVLGPNRYGLLFLAITVFTVFGTIGQLGFAKSAARYVAEFKQKDPDQIPHIIAIAVKPNLVTLLLVGVVLILARGVIAETLGEPSLERLLLYGPVYIVSFGLVVFFRRVFQGFSAIALSAGVNAIHNGGGLICIVMLVATGYGAIGALVGYIAGAVLATLVGTWFLYTRFYTRYTPAARPAPNLRRRILEYSLPITITKNANTLQKQADILLVGFFLSPASVAFYVLSKQILMFANTPATIADFTISPMYGEEKFSDRTDRASKIYEETLIYTLFLYIPATAGLILVAEPLIVYVFGANYLGAVPVLEVFGIYLTFQAVISVTSDGLEFLGRARSLAGVKSAVTVLNIVLNVILIPIYGVPGAAGATVISSGLYAAVSVYIIHKELTLRIPRLVARAAPIALTTLLMLIIVFPVVELVSGLPSLIGVVGLGFGVWCVTGVVTGILEPKQIVRIATG